MFRSVCARRRKTRPIRAKVYEMRANGTAKPHIHLAQSSTTTETQHMLTAFVPRIVCCKKD